MPGIVGIITQTPNEDCERLVGCMVASMQHERFYTSGAYSEPEMGIYAGWVAHENSFAADQVFFNEQRDIALLFSGECFVGAETRSDLRQKGHVLEKKRGDWLLHLYEERDHRFFEELNGLFAGLLIDRRQRKAFLFNDRYGLERIYCHETRDALYFASEAKALLRILPELRVFDEEGIAQFLAFGCTLAERTLFRSVNLLPGGSLWSFANGQGWKTKYFSPIVWESQTGLSAESFQAEFQETFKTILPNYFEAESRIGISLTAGVDSRMIMACLPKVDPKPICYTFSGTKRDPLDAQLAARIASLCGLEHEVLRLGQDFFSDFASHADRTVYLTDGYLGILGAHEIYMNCQARHLAPVRVTGVFGGEILRGVSALKPLYLSPRLTRHDLSGLVNSFSKETVGNSQHPVTLAAFRDIPGKRFGPPTASRSQVSFRTPYLDNDVMALAYRIPEALRTSLSPALRLIKDNHPLLSSIPTDMGELGNANRLRAASGRIFSKGRFKLDYFYNEGLPHWLSRVDPLLRQINAAVGLFGSHKFLHYRSWFGRELAKYVNGALSDVETRRNPLWDSAFLRHLADEQTRSRNNYVLEIDAVLTLDAVERLLFRDLPREFGPCNPRNANMVTSHRSTAPLGSVNSVHQ